MHFHGGGEATGGEAVLSASVLSHLVSVHHLEPIHVTFGAMWEAKPLRHRNTPFCDLIRQFQVCDMCLESAVCHLTW